MKFPKLVITVLSLLCLNQSINATTFRVLFLGNSYTGVNDLPRIISNIASSAGDSMSYLSYSPGGYTLQNHYTDPVSISLINQGNWDFVVLQEQSQLPSFPIGQVQISVYPYARQLDSLISLNNPCAETMYYMTWGRKYGDASNCSSWPPVCTYEGMDSLLSLRYLSMAFDNNGIVSPVGAVWNYIRQNHPSVELYQSDESHPSNAGSYAAACCFYASIFRKDPTTITYDFGIHLPAAAFIRQAAKEIVFNNMADWFIGSYDPKARYNYLNLGGNSVSFANASSNSVSYRWDFNDGSISTLKDPIHYFSSTGLYDVSLVTYNCSYSDTNIMEVNVTNTDIDQMNDQSRVVLSPNPATDFIEIHGLPQGHTNCTLEIINLLGEVVHKFDLQNETDLKFDVRNLQNGFYFANITSNDGFLKSIPFVLK
jgi:hypothetical protein